MRVVSSTLQCERKKDMDADWSDTEMCDNPCKTANACPGGSPGLQPLQLCSPGCPVGSVPFSGYRKDMETPWKSMHLCLTLFCLLSFPCSSWVCGQGPPQTGPSNTAHSRWSVPPYYKDHVSGGWQRFLRSVGLPAALWCVLEVPGSDQLKVGPCTCVQAAAWCPAEFGHPSVLLFLTPRGRKSLQVRCWALPSGSFRSSSSTWAWWLQLLLSFLCSYCCHQVKTQMLYFSENPPFPPKQQDGFVSSCHISPDSAPASDFPISIYLTGVWLVHVPSDWCSLLSVLSGEGPAEPVEEAFGNWSRETALALLFQCKYISVLGWSDRIWPLGFIA